MNTRRTLASVAVVAALVVVAGGFDGSRVNLAERFQRLEDELGAALERAELAEAERDDLAVKLDEVLETLLVEQQHRAEAERKLAECEGRE